MPEARVPQGAPKAVKLVAKAKNNMSVVAAKNGSAVAPKMNLAITGPEDVTPAGVPAGGIFQKIKAAVKVILQFCVHWLKRTEKDLSLLAEFFIDIANSWFTFSKFSKETVAILLAIIRYFFGSSGDA